MKALVVIFIALLTVNISAAETLSPMLDELLASGQESAGAKFQSKDDKYRTYNQAIGRTMCEAYTRCRNGGYVACVSYGNACSFIVSRGNYVRCTGYDLYGHWGTTEFACY